MGTLRIGTLMRTKRWREVVSLIDQGASEGRVAAATVLAAGKALAGAGKDRGVVETTPPLERPCQTSRRKP